MKRSLTILILLTVNTVCIGQDSAPYPMDSNFCIHGKVYNHYLNGNSKAFKTYEHGFLYGPYEVYRKSGQLKEKGFIDDVNESTLLFQPTKVIKERYGKDGELKKSLIGETKPIKQVPYGKCKCADGNVMRIRSLLVGTWGKEKMIPFDNKDQIIDSVYNLYDTRITFFHNDSLSISIKGIQYTGRYFLTSNTLELEMKNDQNNWETLISMRWPVKTLYPNSQQEHFNLELIEPLNVLNEDGEIIPSNVIVKFRKNE